MHYINFSLSPTRYSRPPVWDIMGLRIADSCSISYGMQKPGEWRFVVFNPDPAVCGFSYKTKAELLAALPDYAKLWGF